MSSDIYNYYFVTLFPDSMLQMIRTSMTGRAEAKGIVRYVASDPRDFTTDNHRTVDDKPYGGGPGMVMKPEPVALAIDSLNLPDTAEVILTDPVAPLFTQGDAVALSDNRDVVFVCGHYEGIDERIRERYATKVFSIGDYILTGGELPALVMADSIVRLLPGVLGCEDSLNIDSYSNNLLSYPQYTRPENWRGMGIPEVLKSGHHKEIEKWRREQSELRTREFRPDLLGGS